MTTPLADSGHRAPAERPEKGKIGFAGQRGTLWTVLASWLVPVMMGIAYAFLAATSDTDNTSKAWMALGFVFVLVVWWIFRITTKTAALARAVSVGDSDRILELTPASSQTAVSRAHRAFAYEMAGTWEPALAAAASVAEVPRAEPLHLVAAAAVRVGVLVEAGQVAAARVAYDADLAGVATGAASGRSPSHEIVRHACLALGRVTWAEGDLDAAQAALDRVMRDVRSGSAQRAIAHAYAARIATTRGDAAAAAKHRVEAVRLAPTAWMARVP